MKKKNNEIHKNGPVTPQFSSSFGRGEGLVLSLPLNTKLFQSHCFVQSILDVIGMTIILGLNPDANLVCYIQK